MKISGIVIEGRKEGRKLGFPTANIKISPYIFSGIYAGHVEIEKKKYVAAIYIGNKRSNILEAHLIDFSGDLYGKKITVSVEDKIREDEEEKDENILKTKITEDIKKIKCLPVSSKEKEA